MTPQDRFPSVQDVRLTRKHRESMIWWAQAAWSFIRVRSHEVER